MAELSSPHDKFFKETLARPEAARDFLRYYLPPEVAALLDLTALRLAKDSFVDETLQEHFSDLLYEVRLLDGHDAYVYVLFEHKSYADPLVAFQVLRYMVRVWDYGLRQRARLWPIVPVVVYHGAARWPVALDFHALFDLAAAVKPFVPDFQYWLCDLSQYSDAELARAAVGGAELLLLKHIFRPDLRERLPDVLGLWYTMAQQETALGYLEAMLRYVVTAAEGITAEDVRAVVEQTVPQGGALMATIAQQWMMIGEQRGELRGEQRGEQRGERKGLLAGIRLGLKLKFGAEGAALLPEVYGIEDVALLQAVQDGIEVVARPEELRRIYQRPN